MAMYGLAHEELMFWDTPLSDSVRPRLENTHIGRVTISRGQLVRVQHCGRFNVPNT
jgi:hypothetical protein